MKTKLIVETPEEFLNRGGKITVCPPAIPRKRYHRTSSNNTRLQAAVQLLKSGNYADAIALIRD